ncbi:MAG TPA: hypothetical protein VNR70_03965 [Steroidobacteraceae bacterium]|jgi:folate-dependent tRNA-U54 methylase TrmFO/GidA|nr:hypothetical protein [Steroidobacteraceae bacterium]
MNIQSEIDFFSDLGLVDKARFIVRLMIEVAEEAKVGAGDGHDLSRMKFANEINQRLARFSYQLLSEDSARPQDDVVIRMLLGTRADKNSQRIMQNAYRRVLMGFESFDTTVLLNPH